MPVSVLQEWWGKGLPEKQGWEAEQVWETAEDC